MVLKEAIKDKTAQVEAEMEAAQHMPGFQIKEQDRDEINDDELDEMMDEEEESILRQMAEARIAEMKAKRSEE